MKIFDPQAGTILGEVCHIHAQNEGGLRYKREQSSRERNGIDNLILLCRNHHKEIDTRENVRKLTAARLRKIKLVHESAAKATRVLLPEMTAELIKTLRRTAIEDRSTTTHIDFRHATLSAGGAGGHLGGGGGDGGVINIVGTMNPPPEARICLDGTPGTDYGAGGGGGGCLTYSSRTASSADIANGLRVSSMFPAEYVQIKDLLNILGGAFAFCSLPSIPSPVEITFALVVELGAIAKGTLLQLELKAFNPVGTQVASQKLDVAVDTDGLTPRKPCWIRLAFEAAQCGVWSFRFASGEQLLAEYQLEFRAIRP